MKKTRKSAEWGASSAGSTLHKREGKRQRVFFDPNGTAKNAQTTKSEKGDPGSQNITTPTLHNAMPHRGQTEDGSLFSVTTLS